MKVKFLLQHRLVEGNHAITCLSANQVESGYSSRAEATEAMKTSLKAYLDSDGKAFVQTWMGNSAVINCPEGYIKLPIDLWCCKLTNESCNLQSQVLLQNPQQFMKGCTASEEMKKGILKAASDGRYKGFHHVHGRNLCPTCRGDGDEDSPFNYHYHFELTLIPGLFGIASEDDFQYLLLNARVQQLPSYALACGLCPPCATLVVSILDATLLSNLEVLEMEFFPR